jgi:PAS domain S-box-containing protein
MTAPRAEKPSPVSAKLAKTAGSGRQARFEPALCPGASECHFRSFFANAVEGIFLSTPDGHYLDVNPALARMYGYASPEALMRSVGNIRKDIYVDPTVRDQFKALIERDGRVAGLEYQIRRKDGKVIWICEHARVVRDGAGRVSHYEGTVQDITRRKEAEAARTELEAQLRQSQKLEALGTMAGGIAHDFNNILGAIHGFTEMSLDHVARENPARPYLEEVLTAAQRARELVRQILAFSRQSEVQRQPVQFGRLVKEALRLVHAGLPASIRVKTRLGSGEDWALADPTQMHQLVVNLCTNAGHAMREQGGELHLTLQAVRFGGDIAPPPGLKPGDYLHLEVRDTGHGMPPEVLSRVFEPFFTTKQPGEGTGLGLSVVHGIVKNHGGTITAESEVGKGSRFHVYLPAGERPQAKGEGAARAAIKGRGRILLVDDEEPQLRVLQNRLRRLGYRVVSRSDSQEALRTFRADPAAFDLVITDEAMPHSSGTHLCRELHRLRPGLPAILITGLQEPPERNALHQAGITEILPKPVDETALSWAIHRALLEPAPGKT